MRVVFALRSVEIKPLFRRFVVSFSQEKKHFSLSPFFLLFFLVFFLFFFSLSAVATAGSESLEREGKMRPSPWMRGWFRGGERGKSCLFGEKVERKMTKSIWRGCVEGRKRK